MRASFVGLKRDCSPPAMTLNKSAQSRTDRHIGPTSSNDREVGITPRVLTSPGDGLSPTIPQYAAGKRIDVLVSVPSAPKQSPAATAAADPAEEPPVITSNLHGL